MTPLLMLVSYFLHFPVQRLLVRVIDIKSCCCCISNSIPSSGMFQCQFSSSSILLFIMTMNVTMTMSIMEYFCSFFSPYCSISRSCITNDASFSFLLLVGRAKTDGSLSCLNSRNRSSVTAKSHLVLQCQCQCQKLPVAHQPVSFKETGLCELIRLLRG